MRHLKGSAYDNPVATWIQINPEDPILDPILHPILDPILVPEDPILDPEDPTLDPKYPILDPEDPIQYNPRFGDMRLGVLLLRLRAQETMPAHE